MHIYVFGIFATIWVLSLLAFIFLDSTQSLLGDKGRQNAIHEGILGIINSLSGFTVLFLFWEIEGRKTSYLILSLIVIALIMLFCTIYNIAKTMRESSNDLLTIDLEVSRIHIGFFRDSPRVEGKTNNEEYHIFPLNHGDVHILKKIKEEKIKKIMVTYHSSSHRAVEIRW